MDGPSRGGDDWRRVPALGDQPGSHMWDEAKKRFPVGARVRGVVIRHLPFGIFVDLGDPVALGLVQITDFVDAGPMTPELYPAVGASIEAVVLGHTGDGRKQVWLGMKPSHLTKPC